MSETHTEPATDTAGEQLAIQRQKTLAAGKMLLIAKSAFAREMIRLEHLLPACSDKTGFRLLEKFREECQTYVFGYKRGCDPGLKHAANEMYRLIAVDRADYTTEQMDGFVTWYGNMKGRIARSIGKLFDHHGDSFGDLCDSLPLAGEAVIKTCLATRGKPDRAGFLAASEIAPAVATNAGQHWERFICAGENYVESALRDQRRRWLLHNLLRGDEYFPTEADREAVELAGHYDD